MRRNKKEQELNEAEITLPVFLVNYNQNIPAGFPQASLTALRKFQNAHPTLFKHNNMWSIARHKKKLMDWLSFGPNLAQD